MNGALLIFSNNYITVNEVLNSDFTRGTESFGYSSSFAPRKLQQGLVASEFVIT
jgi:hypothetical protein